MRISLFVFLITCLSSTISCNCKKAPLEVGQDNYGAKLLTEVVLPKGSINGKIFILEVSGKIQDNRIKSNHRLGVIVLPDSCLIKDVAHELVNTPPKPGADVIQLSNNQGFACYSDFLIGQAYAGSLTTFIELSKDQLQDNVSYKAYLVALSQKDNNHVLYSEQGQTIVPAFLTSSLQNSTFAPVVTMLSGQAEKDTVDLALSRIKLNLTGQVTSANNLSQGGFLLIKENTHDPIQVVTALLTQASTLPADKGWKPLADYPNAVIFSDGCKVDTSSQITLEKLDEARHLQRGDTYKAYCYAIYGKHDYLISSQDISITIPKPIVNLAMQEATIQLISNMTTPEINSLLLNLSANIVKHEGTVDPSFGFLFVKGVKLASQEAMKVIADLAKVHGLPKVATFSNLAARNAIIYRLPNPNSGFIGEKKYAAFDATQAGFELDNTYSVCCWLCDQGEVFVSPCKGEKEVDCFNIPKVEGDITHAESMSNHVEKTSLKFNISTQAKSSVNFNLNFALMGFLFVKGSEPGTVDDFKAILAYCVDTDKARQKAQENKEPSIPSDDLTASLLDHNKDKVQVRHSISHRQECEVKRPCHDPFEEKGKYTLQYWLRSGHVLFYSNPYERGLCTYKNYKEDETPILIKLEDGQSFHIFNQAKLIRSLQPKTDPLVNTMDLELIQKVLGEAYKIDGEPNAEAINNFITSMKNKK